MICFYNKYFLALFILVVTSITFYTHPVLRFTDSFKLGNKTVYFFYDVHPREAVPKFRKREPEELNDFLHILRNRKRKENPLHILIEQASTVITKRCILVSLQNELRKNPIENVTIENVEQRCAFSTAILTLQGEAEEKFGLGCYKDTDTGISYIQEVTLQDVKDEYQELLGFFKIEFDDFKKRKKKEYEDLNKYVNTQFAIFKKDHITETDTTSLDLMYNRLLDSAKPSYQRFEEILEELLETFHPKYLLDAPIYHIVKEHPQYANYFKSMERNLTWASSRLFELYIFIRIVACDEPEIAVIGGGEHMNQISVLFHNIFGISSIASFGITTPLKKEGGVDYDAFIPLPKHQMNIFNYEPVPLLTSLASYFNFTLEEQGIIIEKSKEQPATDNYYLAGLMHYFNTIKEVASQTIFAIEVDEKVPVKVIT